MEQPPHYWAFISYSHQDNLTTRADGTGPWVQWANWLHESLEMYRVPEALRERLTPTSEPMPERFFPTFRDEAELPINADLGESIRGALERSRFLIVICSPRSARSLYVNQEVAYFKALGRQDRILAMIVDGEPNARFEQKAGVLAEQECFCPALVHPFGAGGEVDSSQRDAQEPIAGDVRVKSEAGVRELTAREASRHRELLDFTKVKLLAGLMGCGLDELVQRDKLRALAEARRKARRLRVLVAVLATLSLLALGGGIYAWVQRGEANRQREMALAKEAQIRQSASQAQFRAAADALQREEGPLALAHLARAVQIDPRNQSAITRLLTLLAQRSWPLHLRTFTTDFPPRHLRFLQDGRRLIIGSSFDAYEVKGTMSVQVRDWVSGRLLAPPHRVERNSLNGLIVSPNERTLGLNSAHKAFSNAALLPMPSLRQEPVRFDALGMLPPTSNYLNIVAIAADGTSALIELMNEDLGVVPVNGALVGDMPLKFRLVLGTQEEAERSEVAPGERVIALPAFAKPPLAGACTAETVWLIAQDGALWKVDLTTGTPAKIPLPTVEEPPQVVAFSPAGDALAYLNRYGAVQSVSLRDRQQQTQEAGEGLPLAAAVAKAEAQRAIAKGAAADFEALQRLIESSSPPVPAKLAELLGKLGDPLTELDPGPAAYRGGLSWTDDAKSLVLSARRLTDENRETHESAYWTLTEEEGKRSWRGQGLPEGTQHGGGSSSVCFKLRGTSVELLDGASGESLAASIVAERAVTAATAFNPDLFAIGLEDGTVQVCSRFAQLFPPDEPSPAEEAVASAPESQEPAERAARILAVAGARRIEATGASRNLSLKLVTVGRETELSAPGWEGFRSAQFSPDGQTFVAAGAEGLYGSTPGSRNEGAYIFSATDGRVLSPRLKHLECWWAGFSPDGTEIATCGGGEVRFWSPRGEALPRVLNHPGASGLVAWNPAQPKFFITLAQHSSLRVWDLSTGALVRETPWPRPLKESGEMRHLLFDPAGTRFLFVTDATVSLWSADTLELLADPTVAPDLPPNPAFEQVSALVPWMQKIPQQVADDVDLLVELAQVVAQRRIAKDGGVVPLDDQLGHLEKLQAGLQKSSSPLAVLLRPMTECAQVTVARGANAATLAAAESEAKVAALLLDAVRRHVPATPADEFVSPWWILSRVRLKNLEEQFAEARAVSLPVAERLIADLLGEWRKREDPLAVLTLLHLAPGDAAVRARARPVYEQIREALKAEPPESAKDEEALAEWDRAWKAELQVP